MVRQYKIHTNLDGTDDKVWDVTNGKVRFYQPSNLGLHSTNNIWQSNGIGVMGTRSINQPQIEFKLETFGESLEENYQLMKDFVNDIISKKFVTLEYQTEIFQVYADLALADVTKTEGYGKNGTFSEKITFDIITKWYTYENLTFEKIQNGKVIAGKSKIYGGYKGSETALQNYNRLKASPSLNLPNLNLLDGTKDFSGDWWLSDRSENDGTYKGLTVKKSEGPGITKPFIAPKDGVYAFSAYVKGSGDSANIHRHVTLNNVSGAVPIKPMGNNFDWLRDSFVVALKKGDTIYAQYNVYGSGAVWTAGHKWEEVMPITDGFTTVYPNFNLLTDTKDFRNKNVPEALVTTSITSPDSTIVKEGNDTYLHFVRPRYEGGDWPQDWFKAYLIRDSSVSPNFINVDLKPNSQYTFSVWLKGTGEHIIIAYNNWTIPNPTTLTVNLTNTWTKYVLTVNTATNINTNDARFFIRSENVGTEINLKYPKVEEGSIATPWLPSESELQNKLTPYMPSATELTTADISEYFGYNYIANQAYTYYGETNIDRLSRWDLKDEIFSFMGILYPQLPKTPTGVRFLDDIGNEYTAIVFKTEQLQNYILINTDVNDEIYQGWNGTAPLNLFPVMDFERYRTRIIEKGQMELINLSKAEFKVKRKADFV